MYYALSRPVSSQLERKTTCPFVSSGKWIVQLEFNNDISFIWQVWRYQKGKSDNAMAKRKEQIMIYKTLHRKCKLEQHEPHWKPRVNSGALEGSALPAPLLNRFECTCLVIYHRGYTVFEIPSHPIVNDDQKRLRTTWICSKVVQVTTWNFLLPRCWNLFFSSFVSKFS